MASPAQVPYLAMRSHCPRIWAKTFIALLVAGSLAPAPARAANCAGDTTGLTALTDLGAGFYKGFRGGLYPGGTNARPASHDQSGIAIAQSIAPLDTLGAPDPAHGRIVLISIGMSNATQEFQAFVPKAMAAPDRRPELSVIDCAVGGQSADRIRDATAAYWDSVATRLRGHGSSPAQAQIAWLKEADASPTGGFPAATDTLRENLAAVVRVLKLRCPNLKLVFLTSRIYAGYATTALNPEPYAYESGFAVKWLVQEQMAGVDSLNFDAARGPVVAPWLAWGPYLWADGTRGRADGLVWPCDWFASDGTHPAAPARDAVADSLLRFFRADPAATPWFVASVTSVPESPRDIVFALEPLANPARQAVDVAIRVPEGVAWSLDLIDARGRRVGELARGQGLGGRESVHSRLLTTTGAAVAPGVYRLRLRCALGVTSRSLVVLGGRP
jgi:hypothetical protein